LSERSDNRIRSYTGSDLEAIAALLRAHNWAERYVEGQLHAVRRLSSSTAGAVLVAVADESVVGFASLQIHAWNGLSQLQGLAVHPDRLRQGLGAQLVEAIERVARARGCRGISVDTPVDNERARAFYTARGFAEDYRMTRYYADELDGVTYVKFFT
jgi:ribosomal protein S18 acetylase RimI-like enzyme